MGRDPIQATGPDSTLAMIERLIALGEADHQTPETKARLCRDMTDEFTDTVGYCFRELDVAPWGEDLRAERADQAQAAAARDAGD